MNSYDQLFLYNALCAEILVLNKEMFTEQVSIDQI